MSDNSFPASAPSANPLFYRTYSRKTESGIRESWSETVERTVNGLVKLGKLNQEQAEFLKSQQEQFHCLPSGRWLWVGGTEWAEKPENFYGCYNCSSTNLRGWSSFAMMMDLAMMGCGTGAVITDEFIQEIPQPTVHLDVKLIGEIGAKWTEDCKQEETDIYVDKSNNKITVIVGDSRKGWVESYHTLLLASSSRSFTYRDRLTVEIDLSYVRPAMKRLKGFGGVSNPAKLSQLYFRVANILNKAQSENRKLTSVECCLIIDEPAITIVAGNLRRTAGMRQFDSHDASAATAKDNLWTQDKEGNWIIDVERDALRMANHTRVYHSKPSKTEVLDAVTKQFYSGEGAIQYAPEAIARSNADLLISDETKKEFLSIYETKGRDEAKVYLQSLNPSQSPKELDHRLQRFGLNPCFAPGTMVMTRDGHYPIESLVGKEVEVHDGTKWVKIDNFRVTGTDQPVYNVRLYSGEVITATEYHKFILEDGTRIELKDLKPGMKLKTSAVRVHGNIKAKGAYLKGFLIGDGTADKKSAVPICKVYAPKRICVNRLVESQLEIGIEKYVAANRKLIGYDTGLTPAGYLKNLNTASKEWLLPWCTVYKHEFPSQVYNWDTNSKYEFLAGLLDADGTAMDTKNGFGYQITSVSYDFLEGLGRLFSMLNIKWKIGPVRKGGVKDWGDRGGICNSQDTYRITIPQSSSIDLAQNVKFERLKSFADRTVKHKMPSKENVVTSIEYSHVAPAVYCCTVPDSHSFTLSSAKLIGQCGEISGADFLCNLSEVHLNMLDPNNNNNESIHNAFKAAGLSVAVLLNHQFHYPRLQYSRNIDPIVGVSFTGLFDFFVNKFGVSWLQWWAEGRPNSDEGLRFKEQEAQALESWKEIVRDAVWEYCDRNNLRRPNRYTTVQPSGSKALLTGASPGWHPPKAQRFIRRITFRRDDPIALACLDYGYSVVPSQSDKDESGRLLDDPFDSRCTEWLVEIPTEVPWANLEGAELIDINKFSALAQFDFYMQVQKHYVTHNGSATIEYREHEIEPLANRIHQAIQNDEGYISAALLARFDANETFPRLPFEPITKQRYEELSQQVLERRKTESFYEAVKKYDAGQLMLEAGPAGCDSDKCLLPLAQPGT